MTEKEVMRWLCPGSPSEARALQKTLRGRVRTDRPMSRAPRTVCGLDASYDGGMVHAAACLMRLGSLSIEEEVVVSRRSAFPYIPGLLSFREGPALAEAVRGLGTRPDVLLLDGQGIAHPLGIGIASHLGLVLGIPSAGCAKSRLVGLYQEPGRDRGSLSPLTMPDGTRCGTVVRTRTGVRPVFVSPGHMMDMDNAVRLVSQCTGSFRIPEPIRLAHMLAGSARRPGRRRLFNGYRAPRPANIRWNALVPGP